MFSFILKTAIFATGCAGIVAEFVLSTLATYLSGNAVFQWTIVMSLMLFAMGVGSRLSKTIDHHLLEAFIFIEFTLSVLAASSAALAYGLAPWTSHIYLLIYSQALIIGGLIGFEIPLVTRLNESCEVLRSNIAGIMEKDYYGALAGGLLFAFIALPYLGLTYTPVVLGAINFLVASVLLLAFMPMIDWKKITVTAGLFCLVTLAALAWLVDPIIMYGEQRQYRDKIVHAEQTRFQKIVITQYKDYHWLYINSQQQFSSFDEEKYHEPLVHPAMSLSADRSRVLILGGGDGLALREIWKYPDVLSVTMVDLDPAMTDLAKTHPVLLDINQGSMLDPRLTIVNTDAAGYLRESLEKFGVIIIDLPDPDSVDLAHLYAQSFYRLVARHLVRGGVMVTQAASPYFARRVFLSIIKTMRAAGLAVLPYHNQVPTMGEWGWVLAVPGAEADEDALKQRLPAIDFSSLPTRFINNDAVEAMVRFGKGVFDPELEERIRINTQANPVLPHYYRQGVWAMY